jgi:hypothetical protein
MYLLKRRKGKQTHNFHNNSVSHCKVLLRACIRGIISDSYISAGTPTLLAEAFRGFPHYVQASGGIVP